MLRRLVAFAEARPRSAAKMILALCIALVLAVSGFIIAFVDFGDLFEPPYPSEVTPLSAVGYHVTWTAIESVVFVGSSGIVSSNRDKPSEIIADYGGWGCNYSHMRFIWGDSGARFGGIVARNSEQQQLSLGVATTVVSPIGETSLDGQIIKWSIDIVDLDGDGVFGLGDRMTFNETPSIDRYSLEDNVYTIGLVYLDHRSYRVGEFSYAFHNGKFYSWKSNLLDWSEPWWG